MMKLRDVCLTKGISKTSLMSVPTALSFASLALPRLTVSYAKIIPIWIKVYASQSAPPENILTTLPVPVKSVLTIV